MKNLAEKIVRIFKASDEEMNKNKVCFVMLKNEDELLRVKVSFVEKENDLRSFYSSKILAPGSAYIDLIN